LDRRVQNDLDKYVDKSVRDRIEESVKNLDMWTAAFEISQSGVFSKTDQDKFTEIFGKEMLLGLVGFMDGIPTTELETALHRKLMEAREELELLIPSRFEEVLASLSKWA